MGFIFGALLEFACVTYVGDKDVLKKKKKAEKEAKEKENKTDGAKAESNLLLTNLRATGSMRLRPTARLDDEEMTPMVGKHPSIHLCMHTYMLPWL